MAHIDYGYLPTRIRSSYVSESEAHPIRIWSSYGFQLYNLSIGKFIEEWDYSLWLVLLFTNFFYILFLS